MRIDRLVEGINLPGRQRPPEVTKLIRWINNVTQTKTTECGGNYYACTTANGVRMAGNLLIRAGYIGAVSLRGSNSYIHLKAGWQARKDRIVEADLVKAGEILGSDSFVSDSFVSTLEPVIKKLNQLMTQIAQQHLRLETLETRHSDSLDFHDVSVWAVQSALVAAYQAGLAAGQSTAAKAADQVTQQPAA